MKKGKFWPIPKDEIIDGAIYTLRNSKRLVEDSELCLNNNRHTTALTLATLALEEFGKQCLFMVSKLDNFEINEKYWKDNLEDHEKKLLAITRYLRRYQIDGSIEKEVTFEELQKYLKQLAKTKINSIYVDWDGQSNEWYFYNEQNIDENKKQAEKVVFLARWVLDKYLEYGGGELPLTIPENIAKNFLQGKVHGMCRNCGYVITTTSELMTHETRSPCWMVQKLTSIRIDRKFYIRCNSCLGNPSDHQRYCSS